MTRAGVLTWLILLVLASHAIAAEPTRVLRNFDFEERDRGNVEDTPVGWQKVEGPGLPQYVRGQFDESVRASGKASYRLDLDGGGAIYRYPAGKIAATPGAVYRVSGLARTTMLAGARARITAYFADIDGHPLPDSTRSATSDSSASQGFEPLTFDLAAGDGAASLVLEIALLQPAMLDPDASPESRRLFVEDIRGSAWFDDVRVAQVPQVTLSTDEPTNIFYAGQPIALHVRVRDPLVTDLSTELRVVDADGHVAFQRTGGLAFVGTNDGSDVRGSIALPASLPPGWYEATLALRSQDQTIGEHRIRFVRLVDGPDRRPTDARFGVVATGLPPAAWSILPDACERLSAGRVKLSVWSTRRDEKPDDAARLDRALEALRRRDVAITACLSAPSRAMAKAIGGDRWSDLLGASSDRWEGPVADVVARYGSTLTRWQMLDDADAEQMAREPKLRAAYAQLADAFARLTGSARDVAMPWPAWYDFDAQRAPPSVAISVPPAILPEQLEAYVDEARDAPGGRAVSLTLFPIDRAKYGDATQQRDLALRVAHALAAGVDRIDLPLPMSARVRGDDVAADPEPLLPTQRTLVRQLSNARFVGRAALADDVDGFCFDQGGRGLMLVAPRGDAADAFARKLSLTLGRDAGRLDLSGRSSTLRRSTAPGRVDDVDLDVAAMPFFVTDVDLPLVMLRASLALDKPLIESTPGPHARTLTFKNDFDSPITGTIRLAAPKGWIASMSASTFNLNPGETFDGPLSILLPSNVAAGRTKLIAEIRIEERDDRRLTLPVPVTVGLADVGMRSFALRVDGGEVVVQQIITNYGSSPIDYTAFAQVPGRARQERLVSNLAPGKSVVRRYRFAAATAVEAKSCRSGLKELQGVRMLNQEVPID